MAGKNVFSDKDTMDINELASLNDDISPELIEQLQQKLAQDAQILSDEPQKTEFDENDDSTLFEEPAQKTKGSESDNVNNSETSETTQNGENADGGNSELSQVAKNDINDAQPKKSVSFDKNIDDNFIKKYKAKLNKQKNIDDNFIKKYKAKLNKQKNFGGQNTEADVVDENTISNAAFTEMPAVDNNIEELSKGKITEKPLTPEIKNYNDSLDLLDGNVKYSKYVMYIDPQNVDFIESLTVKERKNLINKILKEQNDIAITKQRFRMVQTVIKHSVVAILTIAISIPIIYITINASLEASINNYRRSQSMFQTLYKQGGKIKAIN